MRLQTDLQERVLLSAFRLEDIVTEPMRLHFITCQNSNLLQQTTFWWWTS